MKASLRLEFLKDFIKLVIPEYREMLAEIEKGGGHFHLSSDINLAIERLKVENYPELYRDEIKLNKMTLLAAMPADQINSVLRELDALEGEDRLVAHEEFVTQLANNSLEFLNSIPVSKEDIESAKQLFETLDPNEQQQAIRQAQIALSAFIPTFYQVMTVMVHGRKLTNLVKAAESGDDEAFCLAVQMDKRILSLDYFRDRRNRAELNQEVDFLKSLNYRLTNPLLRGKIRYKTLWLTFAVLDASNYLDGSLKHSELLDFCEEVGVVGFDNRIQDESALGKRLREYRGFQKINQTSRH